jgi:hypothetical protein
MRVRSLTMTSLETSPSGRPLRMPRLREPRPRRCWFAQSLLVAWWGWEKVVRGTT